MKHSEPKSIDVTAEPSRKKKVEVERVTPEHEQYIDENDELRVTPKTKPTINGRVFDVLESRKLWSVVGLILATAFIVLVTYWGIKQ